MEFKDASVSFDPNVAVAFKDHGIVYDSLQITGAFGTVDTTKSALLYNNYKGVVLSADGIDIDNNVITGDGFTITLNDGYTIEKNDDGNYYLK